jgi:hypothetical protein
MAITIIGGLTASTLLTLFLLPSFYLIIDKKNRPPKTQAADTLPLKDQNQIDPDELLLGN